MNQTLLTTKQTRWALALLTLLYLLSVLVHLGTLELEGEEPRRAVVSLEMLQSGNYFNPTLFGWPYYNKPPVFNWVLIGFIQVFRSAAEWVLRLPSLCFYLLWAALHYRFSKSYLGKPVALLSAFFLLTSGDIYFYGLGNGAEIDIFYSFLVYLQVMAIFLLAEKQRWLRLYLWSYLFCAVGFLTKGFPSLLFQGLTLVALALYLKSLRPLLRWQHVAGVALFAAVVGLYLWAYSLQGNMQHLLVNFLNESLAKSAIGERSHKVFEKAVGYPTLLFKLVAPWTLLLLTLLLPQVRRGLLANSLLRFGLLFIACNLWVYWFTGQPKARYVYMFAPFAAQLFAVMWQRWVATRPAVADRVLKGWGSIFIIVAAALAVLPFIMALPLVCSLLASAVVALFACFYFRVPGSVRIWAFVCGVILLRLVYALVFIPFQDRNTAYYEAPVAEAAQLFKGSALVYWAPPQPFVVQVNTRLFGWKADTLLAPPHIHPQIPYYYYRHTGRLMYYDTAFVRGRSQVSFARHLEGRRVDTASLFADKHQTEHILMYRGR